MCVDLSPDESVSFSLCRSEFNVCKITSIDSCFVGTKGLKCMCIDSRIATCWRLINMCDVTTMIVDLLTRSISVTSPCDTLFLRLYTILSF